MYLLRRSQTQKCVTITWEPSVQAEEATQTADEQNVARNMGFSLGFRGVIAKLKRMVSLKKSHSLSVEKGLNCIQARCRSPTQTIYLSNSSALPELFADRFVSEGTLSCHIKREKIHSSGSASQTKSTQVGLEAAMFYGSGGMEFSKGTATVHDHSLQRERTVTNGLPGARLIPQFTPTKTVDFLEVVKANSCVITARDSIQELLKDLNKFIPIMKNTMWPPYTAYDSCIPPLVDLRYELTDWMRQLGAAVKARLPRCSAASLAEQEEKTEPPQAQQVQHVQDLNAFAESADVLFNKAKAVVTQSLSWGCLTSNADYYLKWPVHWITYAPGVSPTCHQLMALRHKSLSHTSLMVCDSHHSSPGEEVNQGYSQCLHSRVV